MPGDKGAGRWIQAAAVIAAVVLGLSLSCFKARNVDLPWHLRTGQWIVENGRVPATDVFNFAREGQKWIDAQWLFQLMAHGSYRSLGRSGPTVLCMILTSLALLLLIFSVPNRVPIGPRALVGVMFILALNSRIQCRPEILTCLYMAAMLFVLERALSGRTRWLLAALPIELAWVNSQGLWPIGPAMVGAFAIDAAADALRSGEPAQKRVLGWWLIALFGCVLAGLCQPYGLDGFLFPLTLLKEVTLASSPQKQMIWEFQPLLANPWSAGWVVPFLALAAVAFICSAACMKRIRPGLTALGLVTFLMALSARRNVSVASVVLASALLAHIAVLAEGRGERLLSLSSLPAAALAIALALAFSILSSATDVRTWDRSMREPGLGFSPDWSAAKATRFLHSIGYKGNIINNVDMGGWLILSGWPDWKVFSDSRMEIPGEGTMSEHNLVFTSTSEFHRVAARYQAGAVAVRCVEPYLEDFAVKLCTDPAWAPAHIDSMAAVFLRRGGKWDDAIEKNEIGRDRAIGMLRGVEPPQP